MMNNSQGYRVQGYHASGEFVSYVVMATDAKNAIDSITQVDNRIIRFTSAKPTSPH